MQPEMRVLEQMRGLHVDLERLIAEQVRIEQVTHDSSVYQTTTGAEQIHRRSDGPRLTRSAGPWGSWTRSAGRRSARAPST